MDNAIEAVYKTEEENKMVIIKIHNYGNNLILYSENKYVQNNSKSCFFQSEKTQLGLHGYGVKIINDLVEANNGHISFEPDNGLFKVTIMLPE